MILGIITFVVLILTYGQFFTKPFKRVNSFFKKMHVPFAILLLILSIVHLILSISVWEGRSTLMIVLGFVSLSLIILTSLCAILRKFIKKNWFKLHIWLSIIVIFVSLAHLIVGLVGLSDYKTSINEIEINEVEISQVADGTYIGDCDAGYICVEVQVSVSNGILTDIKLLKHINERGEKAEQVIEDILNSQTLMVDGVSGATNSSNVIRKAVENALIKGI